MSWISDFAQGSQGSTADMNAMDQSDISAPHVDSLSSTMEGVPISLNGLTGAPLRPGRAGENEDGYDCGGQCPLATLLKTYRPGLQQARMTAEEGLPTDKITDSDNLKRLAPHRHTETAFYNGLERLMAKEPAYRGTTLAQMVPVLWDIIETTITQPGRQDHDDTSRPYNLFEEIIADYRDGRATEGVTRAR